MQQDARQISKRRAGGLAEARRLQAAPARDHAAALRLLEGLLKDLPDDPQILAAIAEQHMQLRNHDAAAAIFQDLLSRGWEPHVPLWGLARIARHQTRFEDSVGLLREAMRIKPGIVHHHVLLAQNLASLYRFEDAVGSAEEALRLSTEKQAANSSLVLADVHSARGDWDAAERSILAALDHAPHHERTLERAINIAIHRRDHEAVAERARKALLQRPSRDDIRLKLRNAENFLSSEPPRPLIGDQLPEASPNAPSPSEFPKLLLLLKILPGSALSGGVFMRTLIDFYPRDRIACFCLVGAGQFKVEKGLEWLPMALAAHPVLVNEAMLRSPDGIAHGERMLLRAMEESSQAIADEVVRFARKTGAEAILTYLNDALLCRVARVVQSRRAFPSYALVGDPPENISYMPRLPRRATEVFLQDLGAVLAGARRCGTISEAMATEYRARFGVESVVLRHGVARSQPHPRQPRSLGDHRLVIGTIGGTYVPGNMEALISALSAAGWKVSGRDVSIVSMGNAPPRGALPGMPIEHLGWMDQKDLVTRLAEVDIGYVPYWFDETYRIATRIAFASKMSTYAAGGCPVLFHGPEGSSVDHFLRRYSMGLCCHSMDPAEILRCLERFVGEPGLYARCAREADRAFEEALSLDVMRRRFHELILGPSAAPA